jgi:hypothetical protein
LIRALEVSPLLDEGVDRSADNNRGPSDERGDPHPIEDPSKGGEGRNSARQLPEMIDRRLIASYQVLAARRIQYDTLMWQAPALALTAQAFLLLVALYSTTSVAGRLIASVLSVAITVVSLQLLEKHRYHELLDSQLLERLEKELGVPAWHSRPSERLGLLTSVDPLTDKLLPKAYPSDPQIPPARTFFAHFPSNQVWELGISLFGIASVIIIVVVVACPALLA